MRGVWLREQTLFARGAALPFFSKSGMLALAVLTLAVALLPGQAFAETDEVTEWLNRAAAAAHRLNYKGTVSCSIFQGTQKARSDFLKIAHYAQEDKEYLRTETLNGSFRETIRINDIVRAYFPEIKTVRVMPSALSHAPPGVMQNNIQSDTKAIFKNYVFTKAGVERVAGRAAQVVVFTPKDNYRYEQRLWIDQETGLFLAGRTIDLSTQRDVESFSFVDIKINVSPPEPLVIAWPEPPSDWKVEQTGFDKKKNVVSDWRASALPPGFSKIAEETRHFAGRTEATTVLVYSDGLMAVSVFIEHAQGATPSATGNFSMGFLEAYTRQDGEYRITAVGKVPNDTLRFIAQGLARK